MLVCTECWQLYENYTGVVRDGHPCPKMRCGGRIADIDELLLPAIILLNEKGYCTEYCCSGHFHQVRYGSAYIAFAEFVERKSFSSLPKGFKMDKDPSKKSVVIRREFKTKDQHKLHRQVTESAIDVMNWAMGLKALPE